jgi:hypothetical protein
VDYVAGARLRCLRCGSRVIVTRSASGDMSCSAQSMVQDASDPLATSVGRPHENTGATTDNSPELGKRYVCQTCQLQVLCLEGGAGILRCHGSVMEQEMPIVLPSAD